MKITTFNPLIVTRHQGEIAELFEELGFARRHHGRAVNAAGQDVSGIRMKDASGFYVDVAENPDIPQDLTAIRINVDDFDETYEMLIAKGFTNPKGTIDTRSNKNAMLFAPSGFAIHLCHHIKNHD